MLKTVRLLPFLLVLFFGTPAVAEDNLDELYRQGRFAEAETAYAQADMDHPKDVRYRYNRGCAAYQNADYDGAVGAFSSVLRRATDDELHFKALYNLGNTAYKRGDFTSAVDHYKQAIFLNSTNEDARYNLELALRELEKQKKNPTDRPERDPQKDSDQQGKEGPGDDQKRNESGDASRESPPGQESQPAKDEADDQRKQESGQKEKSDSRQSDGSDQQKPEPQSPEDLSGELKASRGLPEEQKEAQEDPGSAVPMIDQKKAAALLDNIREDRSRFLRFQNPPEKKRGVRSGRDW